MSRVDKIMKRKTNRYDYFFSSLVFIIFEQVVVTLAYPGFRLGGDCHRKISIPLIVNTLFVDTFF